MQLTASVTNVTRHWFWITWKDWTLNHSKWGWHMDIAAEAARIMLSSSTGVEQTEAGTVY